MGLSPEHQGLRRAKSTAAQYDLFPRLSVKGLAWCIRIQRLKEDPTSSEHSVCESIDIYTRHNCTCADFKVRLPLQGEGKG